MNPKRIMIIAGEASGDTLAAELVNAMKAEALQQPIKTDLHFFGAGGLKMAAAGVELAFDLTQHSVIGLSWVKKYFELRRLFNQLVQLAIERQPDVIVGVDYNLFNLKFARAIKDHVRQHGGQNKWNPKIVKYISPQVWASRESRVYQMARDYDLLLSIFPFEKDWYAKRVPNLRVEFVGHPMLDRYEGFMKDDLRFTRQSDGDASVVNRKSQILLLPGSRVGELKRHLPVMIEAAKQIEAKQKARCKIVLPDEKLKQLADGPSALLPGVEIQIGGLADSLRHAALAISSTGTVLMECAYFGVPTVAMYKTSWLTYQIGKRIIQVKFLAMPNLLANEKIYPEFIQHEATAENIAREALDLIQNQIRREKIRSGVAKIIRSLGGPGASLRAANFVLSLLR